MLQQQPKTILLIAFLIITTYMIIEAIGGILTNSLALLSDAGHMLSDSVSLFIALVAFKLAETAANRQKTFGMKRFEVLAAAVNGLTLIGIALYIFYESIERFRHPPEIASTGMLIIGVIGLIVNIIVAWLLVTKSDTKENLNMRGAYLHVLGDLLGSFGAVIAALLILFFGWGLADPIASVIVAVLVLKSGISVTKSAVNVLMEYAPQQVNMSSVEEILKSNATVIELHDLHVWTVTSGYVSLTAHLVVANDVSIAQTTSMLQQLEHDLHHEGIHHITIQFESVDIQHDSSRFCKFSPEVNAHAHHHH